jgi:hypothetical protein
LVIKSSVVRASTKFSRFWLVRRVNQVLLESQVVMAPQVSMEMMVHLALKVLRVKQALRVHKDSKEFRVSQSSQFNWRQVRLIVPMVALRSQMVQE